MNPKDILIKYWGHTSFRLKQEKIIESILEGRDTLALLPTGGGKSICFQVPTLMRDGLSIVISPLISLMKDQIRHLRSKQIKCVEISSNISREAISNSFSNCKYGGVKFLYISPEQLKKKSIITHINELKINLITVDEAHCISEWGHDFRPAYRNIHELRDYFPNVPILALTATATKHVIYDIKENLKFRNSNTIKASFKRENLSYVVINKENQKQYLLKLVSQIKSSIIVYTKSRKECEEIKEYLLQNNINSNSYHAGIESKERDIRQEAWTNNTTRVIVATSAFGMGIDKPNIRLITHMGIPLSIENYFQQAGRAGRDGKTAYAFLLTSKNDIIKLKKNIDILHPSLEEIKNYYQKLLDFLQIPENTLPKYPIEINLNTFCKKYNITFLKTYNILKILERENILYFSNSKHHPSRIKLLLNNVELYRFQIANSYYNNFIEYLLRSYTGLFTELIRINEKSIAKSLNKEINEIKRYLIKLKELEVIDYIASHDNSQITFKGNIRNINQLNLSEKELNNNKENTIKKFNSIISYTLNNNECRSKLLLSYFGENSEKCGICDYCIETNNK